MKHKSLMQAALVAASLLAAPFALAQPGPGGPDRRPPPPPPGYQQGGPPPGGPGYDRDRPPPGGPGYNRDRPPPGPMGYHRWNKGDRVPAEYRDRQYVIDNWRAYDLPPPRKGYHWMGVGGDYYMVAPSGLIFQLGG